MRRVLHCALIVASCNCTIGLLIACLPWWGVDRTQAWPAWVVRIAPALPRRWLRTRRVADPRRSTSVGPRRNRSNCWTGLYWASSDPTIAAVLQSSAGTTEIATVQALAAGTVTISACGTDAAGQYVCGSTSLTVQWACPATVVVRDRRRGSSTKWATMGMGLIQRHANQAYSNQLRQCETTARHRNMLKTVWPARSYHADPATGMSFSSEVKAVMAGLN